MRLTIELYYNLCISEQCLYHTYYLGINKTIGILYVLDFIQTVFGC